MCGFNKILHVTLCPMLVLVGSMFFYTAQAADANTIFNQDPKLANYFENSSNGATLTKTICPQGSYLLRCGTGVSLGTNWLKGMNKSTSSGIPATTENYYSDDLPASDIIHITNLRKFFAATEPFTYVQENREKSVEPETYKNDKNKMLSHICTDDEGKLVGIECEKCPEGAFVEASSVQQHSTSNKLLWQTWNVHTIADCYATEFSDNTGTYKYIANNVAITPSSPAAPCYYSTNVPGDTLR